MGVATPAEYNQRKRYAIPDFATFWQEGCQRVVMGIVFFLPVNFMVGIVYYTFVIVFI